MTAPPRARPPCPEEPDADPPDADPPDADPPDADPPDTVPGPAEARALIRAQLRIALGTCAVVVAVVAGLPALLALVPAVADARAHGVPLSWLVLALGVQPVWIGVARWQLRRAERAERGAAGPVDRP